jgi:DNA-binding response OmpR family regulator
VVSFVRDAEAMRLTGHLATRISLMRNKRLAKSLDDIRKHNKPANRERFEALLRELYVQAPEVWEKHHRTDWRLRNTRNAVVKSIHGEHAGAKSSKEIELLDFTARETLLKRGRDVGLPPREYELFALVIKNPERFLRNNGKLNHREAAQELGVATGTVKSLWSRTKRTLGAV